MFCLWAAAHLILKTMLHFLLFQTEFCFDFVYSNTNIGFHETDSGLQVARYLDSGSIFVVRETTMYIKYLKE